MSDYRWKLGIGIFVSAAVVSLMIARDGGGEPSGSAESDGKNVGIRSSPERNQDQQERKMSEKLAMATFGGGCFWCTEAVFQELEGVHRVISGYAGGETENPTYKEVCSGLTGHAEVIQVEYDPSVIPYAKLLEVFWQTHDPTTLNRQGADVGTQYRSVVFYHDEEQRGTAEALKKRLNDEQAFGNPVVTEISEFSKLYPAEDYHQDFYSQNPNQGYCRAIIGPKLAKFRKAFADHLRGKQ